MNGDVDEDRLSAIAASRRICMSQRITCSDERLRPGNAIPMTRNARRDAGSARAGARRVIRRARIGAGTRDLAPRTEGPCAPSRGSRSVAQGSRSAAQGWRSGAQGWRSTAQGRRSAAQGSRSGSRGSRAETQGSHSPSAGRVSHSAVSRFLAQGIARRDAGKAIPTTGNAISTRGKAIRARRKTLVDARSGDVGAGSAGASARSADAAAGTTFRKAWMRVRSVRRYRVRAGNVSPEAPRRIAGSWRGDSIFGRRF